MSIRPIETPRKQTERHVRCGACGRWCYLVSANKHHFRCPRPDCRAFHRNEPGRGWVVDKPVEHPTRPKTGNGRRRREGLTDQGEPTRIAPPKREPAPSRPPAPPTPPASDTPTTPAPPPPARPSKPWYRRPLVGRDDDD